MPGGHLVELAADAKMPRRLFSISHSGGDRRRLPIRFRMPIWFASAIAGSTMRLIFRLLALVALAVAVVMAVVDATRTIAADAWTFTPLGESWRAQFPDSLLSLQRFMEAYGVSFLWDPVMTTILSLPGWLVFAVLAFVLHAIGYRRRRPGDLLAAR